MSACAGVSMNVGPTDWTFAVLRLGKLGDDDLQALIVAQAQDVAEVLQPLGADGRGDVERAVGTHLFPLGSACDGD